MKDIAKILKQHFPYHPIPTYAMPFFLFKLLSFFDARITPEYLKDRTVVCRLMLCSHTLLSVVHNRLHRDSMGRRLKENYVSPIDSKTHWMLHSRTLHKAWSILGSFRTFFLFGLCLRHFTECIHLFRVARRGPKKRSLFGMAVLLLCLAGVIGYLWRRRSQKRIAAI